MTETKQTSVIEGYAAIFDEVDTGQDLIKKHAFRGCLSLGGRDFKLLFNHNPQEPIGEIIEIYEDSVGLYIKAKLDCAHRYTKDILDKLIDGLSIGYHTLSSSRKNNIRILEELDLWEISICAWPMNKNTRIISIQKQI